LDVTTFRMERLETGGDAPGWIYGHRVALIDSRTIRITGGTIVEHETERRQRESKVHGCLRCAARGVTPCTTAGRARARTDAPC
jgi:hypothetical protein